MKALQYPFFWGFWSLGLTGFLLWFLVKWFDPLNRQVSGSFKAIVNRLWQPTMVALVSHFILCLLLASYSSLDEKFAIASGFGSQSIVPSVLNILLGTIKKFTGNVNGNPYIDNKPLPPPDAPPGHEGT